MTFQFLETRTSGYCTCSTEIETCGFKSVPFSLSLMISCSLSTVFINKVAKDPEKNCFIISDILSKALT